ncbi:hypothetical protein PIB30_109236, partial [Stylosanthes scabra]|nr:hypothetical protein [Stylosanthes scabra]
MHMRRTASICVGSQDHHASTMNHVHTLYVSSPTYSVGNFHSNHIPRQRPRVMRGNSRYAWQPTHMRGSSRI